MTKQKPGLPAVGAAAYAEHLSTEALCLFYRLPTWERPHMWTPEMSPPQALFEYIAQGGIVEAVNSLFEYFIWHYVCHSRMGWPALPLEQTLDAAALARAWALPGGLDNATKALGCAQKKDGRGKQLMRLLSVPKNPTKKDPLPRRTPLTHPVEYGQYYAYCGQDVIAEDDLSSRLPFFQDGEYDLWKLDQRINVRGVAMDIPSIKACIKVVDEATAKYNGELQALTEGAVQAATETTKLRTWLEATQGTSMPSVDAAHVEAAIKNESLPPVARRALEIRSSVASASVKKLYTMDRMVNRDGRLRGLFNFCGASRTGRFSGSAVQPQNLKSHGPDVYACPNCTGLSCREDWCPRCEYRGAQKKKEWGEESVERCLLDVRTYQRLDWIEYLWGDAIDVIGSCLRGLFVAGPGRDLVCADFSAIEAVVLAFLAGEQWRMDLFNNRGKIYEMSASKMFGVPYEEILEFKKRTGSHHELRKKGKISELLLGFGGWIRPIKKELGPEATDQEAKDLVLKWRAASPAIVEFWGGQYRETTPGSWEFRQEYYGLEGAAVLALLNPGHTYSYRSISYVVQGRVLYCRLPSGRCLSYHSPRLEQGIDRRAKRPAYKIFYWGYNTDPKKGPTGWVELQTYGGKLAENCVSGDAEILTPEGWIKLRNYEEGTPVWDGEAFVYGGKLIDKGFKDVITLYGVDMTPEHKVLCCDNEWREADEIASQSKRFNRKEVRTPHSSGGYGTTMPNRGHVQETRRKKQVYDIMNCGPRSRFVVRPPGGGDPIIAHNCTQAAARDILKAAMLRVDATGRYDIVLHVHDEITAEVIEGQGSFEELEQLMSIMPEWCADWPVRAAGGWLGKRFRK